MRRVVSAYGTGWNLMWTRAGLQNRLKQVRGLPALRQRILTEEATMRRRWTITTHATGRPRDVDVILYDKLSHMRQAASRHANTWEPDNTGFDNAEGVCHGFQLFEIHDDGTEKEQQRAVILRFTRGHISPELVSHEVAHAAQHLYGLDCLHDGTIKDHFNAGNETFAWLLGDLFATVWTLTQDDNGGDDA